MFQVTPRLNFMKLLAGNRPRAYAKIKGNSKYPQIHGFVRFYESPYGGLLIEIEVFGLPDYNEAGKPVFHGTHIHENGDCSDDFSKVGEHYNSNMQMHPHHVGDLPQILSNQGYAWQMFYDSFLELYDVIGRAVIIHANADDFATQPSGNSGEKIACGEIKFADDFKE